MRTVRTDKYEWSYGKKPRGTGSWAFGNRSETVVWFEWGSYAEAKKKAIAKANEMIGSETLYVLP